jgi:hypothetical protein
MPHGHDREDSPLQTAASLILFIAAVAALLFLTS